MRIMTSARLRAVGFLLLEAAGVGLLVAKQVSGNPELRAAVLGFFKKARAL